MRCKYCKNEAIVKVKKRNLCRNHFNQYYNNRIKKVLKKIPLKDKKILIAISGGKDSIAISHFFSKICKKFGFTFELLFIDLGIDEFSKKSFEISENLSKILNTTLNVIHLKEEYGSSILDISKKNRRICSLCGTIKRYVVNDFAYKNNFDFVVTGHNMNDEIIFLKQNILSNSIDYIKRYTRFYTETLKNLKLIGKIKPQFFVTEEDNRNYCLANELEFITDVCPFSERTPHKKLQSIIEELDKKMDYSYSFLNFFLKLNHYLPEKNLNFTFCSNCGYPTVNKEICKFCRIMGINL